MQSFTHFSGVSIADFEQVNVGWDEDWSSKVLMGQNNLRTTYTIQNIERKTSEIFKDWLTTNLLEKNKEGPWNIFLPEGG